ncbi:MAG: single-stranded-DNA-specific exonuclease RecJ [Bacteroidetes bacterium CG23_combo_of_CG06-09_8_20_14_all_32_9]|nr:MAG: single-stranded-DNA-specific exonuclease RecJ [Bacteroidetes bacterium CG23_combo_of_CG06-09_8_20_14_all_32_9]
MEKTWVLKPRGDETLIQELAKSLSVDPVIANLLVQRGITTFKEADEFFNPDIKKLHDPFLMKDMDKAIMRIEKALNNNEKILIYGDYDVDGTTAVAMLYSFFRKRYSQIRYYIPDRYGEGYGISFKGIDYAANNAFTLVIALDCGIKAVEKIKYANKKGVDFIICDHHLPGDTIPQAVAVLDAKQPGCKYPYKELSGCGVGFKLIQAFCIKRSISFNQIYTFLDLVAVSIASDIVPITDENRILAFYGMEKLNKEPVFGLKAIKKVCGIDDMGMNINDIVFKIGPRINAAGRIETGSKAVELLVSQNEEDALKFAKGINIFNENRRDLDQKITAESIEMINSNEAIKNKKTTVLYNPEWHKGVVGIVASRLIEHYYRPTIILTKSNGFITGSARTVEGFDLYHAIDKCGQLLENYGGHKFAAGISLKPENLNKFIEMFEKVVSESITEKQLIPHIEIDDVLKLSQIDAKFFRILQRFQPYGPENMNPVFVANNVFDSGIGKTVGKKNEHLKLDLRQDSCPGSIFPAIGFGLGSKAMEVAECRTFDVCFSVDKNDFMNKTSLQLRLRDIQLKNLKYYE